MDMIRFVCFLSITTTALGQTSNVGYYSDSACTTPTQLTTHNLDQCQTSPFGLARIYHCAESKLVWYTNNQGQGDGTCQLVHQEHPFTENSCTLMLNGHNGYFKIWNVQGCTLGSASSTPNPAPSNPSPSNPAPSNPAPSNPAPSNPAPSNPAPSNPAPSNPAPSPSNSADVVGDPITYYNGVKTEFWLPLGELTLVMKMPDLEISVSTFQGHGEEQWMDRVVVKTPQQETVVDVRIRKGLLEFDKAKSLPGNFQTLDVHIDWAVIGPAMPLVELPPADLQFTHWRGLVVQVAPFRMNLPLPQHHRWYLTHIGEAQREGVFVVGDYGKVMISSISAAEFYGSGTELSVKYAHLDFSFLDMQQEHTFTGILPELWGIRPLSEETRLLMKAPESRLLQNVSFSGLPNHTACIL